ncbi:hypothetical protein BN970_04969 [Mycolicibacterium conceptionense]|uniref:Uncharacterized protein n=1 Tax=Mycolicibacterium conceptionense TaxID=451644 RepID=A0A0U1DUH3_9MYCO|nr:hypothetical protein BN970_04969 [Mycolicibacterium conceptionense]
MPPWPTWWRCSAEPQPTSACAATSRPPRPAFRRFRCPGCSTRGCSAAKKVWPPPPASPPSAAATPTGCNASPTDFPMARVAAPSWCPDGRLRLPAGATCRLRSARRHRRLPPAGRTRLDAPGHDRRQALRRRRRRVDRVGRSDRTGRSRDRLRHHPHGVRTGNARTGSRRKTGAPPAAPAHVGRVGPRSGRRSGARYAGCRHPARRG